MLLNATVTVNVDLAATADETLQCIAEALLLAAYKLERESGGPRSWNATAEERRKWAFLGRE